MKLTKEIIEAIEKAVPEIGITENDNYYSVHVDNTCGQDFSYEIEKGENEVEELINCCENYDAEEEFRVWYGANNGEPSNPGTLWENCEEIGENLDKLQHFLEFEIMSR